MANFISLILTKDNIYYLPNSGYFQDIIKHYNLQQENVVKVELSPPYNREDIRFVNKWSFFIHQESFPSWISKNAPSLEYRTRNFVAHIIQQQNIAQTIKKGNCSTVQVGFAGTAIAENNSKAISGVGGRSITSDYGLSISGNNGISITEQYGTAISGERGTAIAGLYGTAIVGNNGHAMVGCEGKTKAGKWGEIQIKYFDYQYNRRLTLIGYVGLNGIRPNAFYKVENGKFVPAE